MMPMLSNRLWPEIMGVSIGVSLLKAAVIGKLHKGRSQCRYWPVPFRLRPIFGILGFGLVAFALIDFFEQLLKL
jgi:hypothetical protein